MDETIGQKFGSKTVIKESKVIRRKGKLCKYYWVKCDCGREFEITRRSLLDRYRHCEVCRPRDFFGVIR